MGSSRHHDGHLSRGLNLSGGLDAANPLQEIEQTLHTIQGIRQDVLQQLLAAVGENWDPANGTINGVPYLDYTNPLTLVYWVTRYLSVQEDFHAFLQALETNPLQLLQSLGSLTPVQIVPYLSLHPIIAGIIGSVPSVNTASVAGAAAAASSVAAVAGVAALPVPVVPAVAPVLAPVAAVSNTVGAVGLAPTLAGSVTTTPVVSTPVTAAGTVASSAPPPAPPAPAAQGFFPYAVGGGPGTRFDTGRTRTVSAVARVKAPETDVAAVAAAAAARRRRRSRRRQDAV